jgi:hypothetical protein
MHAILINTSRYRDALSIPFIAPCQATMLEIMVKTVFNNTHQLYTLHNHFHFIKTQSLNMFRTSLAHPQEARHEHSFGGCSVL